MTLPRKFVLFLARLLHNRLQFGGKTIVVDYGVGEVQETQNSNFVTIIIYERQDSHCLKTSLFMGHHPFI